MECPHSFLSYASQVKTLLNVHLFSATKASVLSHVWLITLFQRDKIDVFHL